MPYSEKIKTTVGETKLTAMRLCNISDYYLFRLCLLRSNALIESSMVGDSVVQKPNTSASNPSQTNNYQKIAGKCRNSKSLHEEGCFN